MSGIGLLLGYSLGLQLGLLSPFTGLYAPFDTVNECVVWVVFKTAFKPFSAHGVEVKFVGFIGVETGFVFGVIPRHGVGDFRGWGCSR